MSAEYKGRIDWSLSQDQDGHRDYKLRGLVVTTDVDDGPKTAFLASGAPAVGAPWAFGNDSDPWAFCWPTASITPLITKEPGYWFILENLFTTRPLKRCQDSSIENPLAEPQGISGSFVKYTQEVEVDRFGRLVVSSSHERIRGLERDRNRPTVVIEQNVADLDIDTFAQMVDCCNDATLWGLPPRTIKLSNVTWSRKIYGTCSYYYTRRFEFDIRYETFDFVDVADAGFKKFDDVRFADNEENRADPRKFILAKDGRGGNPPQKVLLDGTGSPLGANVSATGTGGNFTVTPVFLNPIEVYGEVNMLVLNIPTSL